jgi:D-inositol-3-phosphate glycosyltransferase
MLPTFLIIRHRPTRYRFSLNNIMQTKKIALFNVTTTTKTGGVESFVWELARNLAQLYPDLPVDIIGGKPPKGFKLPETPAGVRLITRPFIARETWRKIPFLKNRFFGFTKLLERLTFGLMCLPLLWRENYAILHIQKPYDLPVAKLIRLLRGTKLLFGCHGKDFFPLDRLFAKKVDGAVSCSRYNAETVRKHYGILPEIVYNGIDVELFSPRPPDLALRAKYAAPDEPLIIFIGRLVRWKGTEYLIKALPILREKGLQPKVLIAGDGTYKHTLQKIAEELGVSNQVIFLGTVPNRQLPDYYAISEVVVGTSFANETFGIALCEAAACERPIVASRFGGFQEVVRDGETGYFYEPQNPHALAEKLEILLRNPHQAEQMGKSARQFIVENFTWQKVAARVYHAYAKIS